MRLSLYGCCCCCCFLFHYYHCYYYYFFAIAFTLSAFLSLRTVHSFNLIYVFIMYKTDPYNTHTHTLWVRFGEENSNNKTKRGIKRKRSAHILQNDNIPSSNVFFFQIHNVMARFCNIFSSARSLLSLSLTLSHSLSFSVRLCSLHVFPSAYTLALSLQKLFHYYSCCGSIQFVHTEIFVVFIMLI